MVRSTGSTGDSGDSGSTGSTGDTGSTGSTGDSGSIGSCWANGDTGRTSGLLGVLAHWEHVRTQEGLLVVCSKKKHLKIMYELTSISTAERETSSLTANG